MRRNPRVKSGRSPVPIEAQITQKEFQQLLKEITEPRIPTQKMERQFLQDVELPLFFIQGHGSVISPPQKIRLRTNEFVIIPTFNEVMPTCTKKQTTFLQGLKQTHSLREVATYLAQTYPLQYSVSGKRSKGFQLYDENQPCPNMNLSTDDSVAKGILRNVHHARDSYDMPSQLGKSRMTLEEIINFLREKHPLGWIITVHACTVIQSITAFPATQQQQFQNIMKQGQLEKQSGIPVQSYFPGLQVKKAPPVRFDRLVEYYSEPMPKKLVIDKWYGTDFKIVFGTAETVLNIKYKDRRNRITETTSLEIDGQLYKTFPVREKSKTPMESIQLPMMPSFTVYFQPVSYTKDPITKRRTTNKFKVDVYFSQVLFRIKKPGRKAWEEIGLTKENLKIIKEHYPNPLQILKVVQFDYPFRFSFLVLRDRLLNDIFFITSEKNVIINSNNHVISLSSLYRDPERNPMTEDIMIRVINNEVQIYQTNHRILPQDEVEDWLVMDQQKSQDQTLQQDWIAKHAQI